MFGLAFIEGGHRNIEIKTVNQADRGNAVVAEAARARPKTDWSLWSGAILWTHSAPQDHPPKTQHFWDGTRAGELLKVCPDLALGDLCAIR